VKPILNPSARGAELAALATVNAWTLTYVDLGAYTGQTVWLRFTWFALPPAQPGEALASWRLDDVQIIELPPTPTPIPTETPTDARMDTASDTPVVEPPVQTPEP
jgi:hypothetical protein